MPSETYFRKGNKTYPHSHQDGKNESHICGQRAKLFSKQSPREQQIKGENIKDSNSHPSFTTHSYFLLESHSESQFPYLWVAEID